MLFHEGWPTNHEALTWAYRSNVYAAAFARGEWLPLWDENGVFGLGSPMPLIYHKLYYLLAGFLQFIGLAGKTAAIAALSALALVGSLGIFSIGGQLQLSYAHRLMIATTFPHLNYVTTDWMVRGALAEFSALCLATWLIWWCFSLLNTVRVSLWISLLLLLTMLAHNVIAYFALIPLTVAFLIVFKFWRNRRCTLLKQLAAAIFLFLMLGLPLVLLILQVNQFFDVSYITSIDPVEQYKPLPTYLYDPNYQWGENWFSYTVQLDLPLTVGIGSLSILWMLRSLFSSPTNQAKQHHETDGSVSATSSHYWWFLATTLSIFVWMQHPSSAAFYEFIPGAQLLQFPWRLLGYISVLLLVVLMMLVRMLEDGRHSMPAPSAARFHPARIRGFAILWVIVTSMLFFSLSRSLSYDYLKESCFAHAEGHHWPEYFPRTAADYAIEDKKWVLLDLADRGPEAHTCGDFISERLESPSSLEVRYLTKCSQATTVRLPIAYSGIESVWLRDADVWSRIAHKRTDNDPRVAVTLPAGINQIKVKLPSVDNFWGHFAQSEREDGSMLPAQTKQTNDLWSQTVGGGSTATPPIMSAPRRDYDVSMLTQVLQPYLTEGYTVLLATHDDNDLALIAPLTQQLAVLESDFVAERYRGAYAAIFIDGTLAKEDTGLCRGAETRKIIDSHRVRAFAGINHALLEIDGKNFSVDLPGINALVWDKRRERAYRFLFIQTSH